MAAVLLAALLASASVPGAQGLRLGRLDPGQLLGAWYVLAVASGERGFARDRATRGVEGLVVTLTPEHRLRLRVARPRLERCELSAVELRRRAAGWVFENPGLGVLQYRVLGTDFRAFAVVLTQRELRDEAFSTVELYSRTALPSPEAMRAFTRWSRDLGFLAPQRARLQRDLTCAHKVLQ